MTILQNTASFNGYSSGQSRTLSLFGATGSIKAASADTNGSFGLIEITVPPHFRYGAPHWHAQMTEAFYMLEGTLAFTLENQTFTATLSGFVLVPPRTVHHFWNPTSAPATFLNFFTPGGFEVCFAELAAAFANAPFDAKQMIEIAAKYDQFAPPVGP
jgi:quercetin dioxygenase-like cupin family protein